MDRARRHPRGAPRTSRGHDGCRPRRRTPWSAPHEQFRKGYRCQTQQPGSRWRSRRSRRRPRPRPPRPPFPSPPAMPAIRPPEPGLTAAGDRGPRGQEPPGAERRGKRRAGGGAAREVGGDGPAPDRRRRRPPARHHPRRRRAGRGTDGPAAPLSVVASAAATPSAAERPRIGDSRPARPPSPVPAPARRRRRARASEARPRSAARHPRVRRATRPDRGAGDGRGNGADPATARRRADRSR